MTTYTMLRLQATRIAWYRRLFAVVKLPYDLIRFVVTGRAYIGHFRKVPDWGFDVE